MKEIIVDKFFEWALANKSEYKPTVSALYFFLVMVYSKLGYPKEFSVSAKECMEGMGVSSYNTYKNAFNVLINNSFIKVVSRSCNHYQANIIRMMGVDIIVQDKEEKIETVSSIPVVQHKPNNDLDMFGSETPPPLTEVQEKKSEKAKKYKYGEFVTLTRDEYAKLCEEFSEDAAKRMIEILDNYKGSKGKTYKSDYRAILNWVVSRYNEEIQKHGIERKTINGGGCTSGNTGYATAEIPFESGRSNSSSTKPPKDYSERF